jgi:hypothetical protein
MMQEDSAMNLRWLALIGFASLSALPLPVKANDTYIESYWSPNSDKIALLGTTDIVIFDSDFQVEQRIILPPSPPPPIGPGPIVWSPLEDTLAVYVGNFNLWSGGSVEIWDIATGQRIGTTGENPSSDEIIWHPDNEQFSTFNDHQSILDFYNIDGSPDDSWEFRSFLWVAVWSPNGLYLATYSEYGDEYKSLIEIWDPIAKRQVADIPCTCGIIKFSPDGRLVLSQENDYSNADLQVWEFNPETRSPTLYSAIPVNDRYTRVDYGWRDNTHLWRVGQDGDFFVWRFDMSESVIHYQVDMEGLESISPDGTKGVYRNDYSEADRRDSITIKDLKTGRVLAVLALEGNISPLENAVP